MCKTSVDLKRTTDFKALALQEPQVISLTFYRESISQRLGIKLGKDGGDVFVAALDERKGSMLRPSTMPIRVGDLLIALNNQACYGLDLETLKLTMAQSTGLVTLLLRKTAGAALQDKVKLAIFVSPKAYTCLPMEIDFCKDNQQALTIASLNPQNEWLTTSCLKQGQVILGINGTSSYQLEEEDAKLFLQTKNDLDPYLSIKTFTPSLHRASSFSSGEDSGDDDNIETRSYLKQQRQRMRQMLTQRRPATEPEKEQESGGTASRMRQLWKQEGMETYVVQQTARFEEILSDAKTDSTIDEAGEIPVLASCKKLFIAMKQSIDGCRKGTTGESYFRLYQSFGDVLRRYAQILSNAHMSVKSFRRPRLQKIKLMVSSSPSIALAADGELFLCHVIATSKYCADTVELIEELIQETIDAPYKSKIDMISQQEAFHNVTAKAMTLLVFGLHHRLDKSSFAVMAKLPWVTWEQVDDTNDYVYSICQGVQNYIDTAKGLLPTPYFRSLCDKVAVDVADTFYATMIAKCNRTSAAAKQQLLLDAYTLKSFFLKLLKGKKCVAASSVAMYEKMVVEKFQKIESLLKMAACSDTDLQEFLNDII
jgi:hypothetical protein